ncbi:MAG: VWA domain-containing protein [Chloroflexi bacterium]|nr:VWA domain-containing protein [Chloroflexota bacterium]
MKFFPSLLVALVLAVMLLPSRSARADGVIIPHPPPEKPIIVPFLDIKYHRVKVTIDNQVATTRIDQVFINDSDLELEGTYIFPLPSDAAISNFTMYVDGKPLSGQVLDKDKARRIYEDIVRSRQDPALLEYVGRGAFQARVFPIPAHGEKRIELEYSQVLAQDKGLVRYLYPLNTERFSPRPLREVTINVDITSKEAIKAIYSPSHEVAISRPDDHHAKVSYEASNVQPQKDFELIYTMSKQELGLNILTHRSEGEDGYFLLLVAPGSEVEEEQVVAKDVVMVIDTSGSMKGEKLTQAKEALRFVLSHLNAEDRFNIIAFNTTIESYAQELRSAQETTRALEFVASLAAAGGTNINDALLRAIAKADPERPHIVLFLTDGLPTSGVTDAKKILANVAEAAGPTARIFAFGVGDDVNTLLLDALAQAYGGVSRYVRPGERVDEEVSQLYTQIQTPVLSGLELDFGDIKVSDIYPRPFPDLFLGSQLVVAGRYQGSGQTRITLRGQVNGKTQTYKYIQNFPKEAEENDFVPRLWALRKVGYLLEQIRWGGPQRQVVDEIVELATRYGIVTPYTSFLVEEPHILTPEGRRKAQEDLYGRAMTPAPVSGSGAVEKSEALQGLRESTVAAEPSTKSIKAVGAKTFILEDGIWKDTTYRPGEKTKKLVFGSEDYFEILSQRPDLGRYFALGDKVIVVDSQAYEVVADGSSPQLEPSATPTAPDIGLNQEGSEDSLLSRLWRWVRHLFH